MSVNPADVEATIASEHYFTACDGVAGVIGRRPTTVEQCPESLRLITFCVLALRNGHTVTGESYCQDPAKFNALIGQDEARKAAIDKLWPMVVYAARAVPDAAPVAPKQKTYTMADVARHVVNRMSMTDEIEYFIEMRDGASFTGNVKPSNYSAWQSLAIADINRQAAA